MKAASNKLSFKNVLAKGPTMGTLSTLSIFCSQAIASEYKIALEHSNFKDLA